MKKRLPVLALCLILLMSALLLAACEPKRSLERTYNLQMTSEGTNSPMTWQLRLHLEVDIRSKTVDSVTWVPIMENGVDVTYLGSQPNNYLNDKTALNAFLETLSGTSFSQYKGLAAIRHYDDLYAPDEHLAQFEISSAGSPPEVSMAFVIDAVAYILKQHRYI